MGEGVPNGHQPQTHKNKKTCYKTSEYLSIYHLSPSFEPNVVLFNTSGGDGRLLLRWLTPRTRKNKHQPHLFFCVDSKSGNSFPPLSLTWSDRPLKIPKKTFTKKTISKPKPFKSHELTTTQTK